jgi:hypothetical protein
VSYDLGKMLVIIAIIMILNDQCAGGAFALHPGFDMLLSSSSILLEHPSFHLSNNNVRGVHFFLTDRIEIEASSTFCLMSFLTYSQSQYRHLLHAPGPRRHSVGGRSSVYSNCAGFISRVHTQKFHNPHLQIFGNHNADWRRVLSSV